MMCHHCTEVEMTSPLRLVLDSVHQQYQQHQTTGVSLGILSFLLHMLQKAKHLLQRSSHCLPSGKKWMPETGTPYRPYPHFEPHPHAEMNVAKLWPGEMTLIGVRVNDPISREHLTSFCLLEISWCSWINTFKNGLGSNTMQYLVD